MDIELLKIAVNVGLFVLIWMVQLVVYPSFSYFTEANIKKWHPIYTTSITYIVFPLMLTELLVYIFLVYQSPSVTSIISLVLVLSTWLITIFMAVPLHHKIDTQVNSMEARKQLVQINWLRTLVWTLILIISLVSYGK